MARHPHQEFIRFLNKINRETRTLFPLDDVLGCLHATIPKLSRSALHCYLDSLLEAQQPTSI